MNVNSELLQRLAAAAASLKIIQDKLTKATLGVRSTVEQNQ